MYLLGKVGGLADTLLMHLIMGATLKVRESSGRTAFLSQTDL